MTRVVRNAAVLCAAGILVASAALANVPDPNTTTTSNGTGGLNNVILAQGTMTAGANINQPDFCEAPTATLPTPRCGRFTVVVRDFANNVIAGSVVSVDFSACPDISVSCNQLTAATGQTQAAGKKVLGTTNAAGSFTFAIQGAATSNSLAVAGTGISPGTGVGLTCATLFADGVNIKSLRVSAVDLNGGFSAGGNGVNGTDAAICAKEVLAVSKVQRSDISQDAAVNGLDASREAQWVIDSGSPAPGTGSNKTGTYCP